MLGYLTNPQRVDWREKFSYGEKIKTYYQSSWHDGIVTGWGPNDTLKVDVLNADGVVLFASRITTRDAVFGA